MLENVCLHTLLGGEDSSKLKTSFNFFSLKYEKNFNLTIMDTNSLTDDSKGPNLPCCRRIKYHWLHDKPEPLHQGIARILDTNIEARMRSTSEFINPQSSPNQS
jgi:hypothetical protein